MGVLIDTCVWIDVERGYRSASAVQRVTGREPVFISPVTIAELTHGAEMASDEGIRQRRFAALEQLKRKPLLYIGANTGTVFGRLSSVLKRQGRGADFRIQDVWLAAQAVENNFYFLTRNTKDFQDIPGLCLLTLP